MSRGSDALRRRLGGGAEEGFLGRWSQRKAAAREGVAVEPEVAPDETLEVPAEPSPAREDAAPAGADQTAPEAIDPETLPDIASLTRESDFTPFMQEGVPLETRNKALHKLWRSDPVLANLDGLNDYDEDFTKDGLNPGAVRSLWKVGQGFLTDSEVAAWRGEKAPEADADASGAESEDVPVAAADTPDGETPAAAQSEVADATPPAPDEAAEDGQAENARKDEA